MEPHNEFFTQISPESLIARRIFEVNMLTRKTEIVLKANIENSQTAVLNNTVHVSTKTPNRLKEVTAYATSTIFNTDPAANSLTEPRTEPKSFDLNSMAEEARAHLRLIYGDQSQNQHLGE